MPRVEAGIVLLVEGGFAQFFNCFGQLVPVLFVLVLQARFVLSSRCGLRLAAVEPSVCLCYELR